MIWERCRMCGEEWPKGSRTECPHYRNAEHRRFRTNVRSQDVAQFEREDPTDAPRLSTDDSALADTVGDTMLFDADTP